MLRILFKTMTLVFILSTSAYAMEQENPVFEQLKDDMWQMGLEFDYSHGAHVVMPSVGDDTADENGDIVHSEEISRALSI